MQGQRGKSIFNQEFIRRDDIIWLSRFACTNSDYQMKQFFLLSKYDPQFVIFKSDFQEVWSKVKDLEMFKWIPEIVQGMRHKHLNVEIDAEP